MSSTCSMSHVMYYTSEGNVQSLVYQMAQALKQRQLPPVLLFSLVPIGTWFIVRPLLDPLPPLPAFHAAVGFSIFAFLSTIYLVPALGPTFIKARLSGRDLLKTYDTPMYVQRYSPWSTYGVNFRAVRRVLAWYAHRCISCS